MDSGVENGGMTSNTLEHSFRSSRSERRPRHAPDSGSIASTHIDDDRRIARFRREGDAFDERPVTWEAGRELFPVASRSNR